jgi:hypothetical protein
MADRNAFSSEVIGTLEAVARMLGQRSRCASLQLKANGRNGSVAARQPWVESGHF